MTNAMIIEQARIELMKSGVIGTTGKMLKSVDSEGNVFEVEEPEEIHTYQAWKSLGYQVQKGQKAIARFKIWKHVTKKGKGEDEVSVIDDDGKGKMFMTTAYFFKKSQVELLDNCLLSK